MKSSIKVEYDYLFSALDDKQPIVKVRLSQSDDPRDTLLNCIFSKKSKLGFSFREVTESEEVYVLYAKNRYEQVCNIAENVFEVLSATLKEQSDLTMCTSSTEIYFENVTSQTCVPNNIKYKRSKGCNRELLNSLDDKDIIKGLVADFTAFMAKK